MGLRERSKQIALGAAAEEPAIPEERLQHRSLRERAQDILRRATGIFTNDDSAPETKIERPSLRERALAFLRGEAKPVSVGTTKESKPHKGLLARAKELLGLVTAGEDGSEEKKNPEVPLDSSSEPSDIELAAAPEPGEEPLEHIIGEEEEVAPEPVDPALAEKVGDFFDKLASAIKNLDYTLRDRLDEQPAKQEKEEEKKEAQPVSSFFDDEESARPQLRQRALRPVKPGFFREEVYLEEFGARAEEIPPEPQLIIPSRLPFERRDPYEPSSLQLTYRMSEIIPPGSPYEFHARALRNAEHYLEQGQFRDAIHVLERTAARITDKNIHHKILRNIQDIEDYLKKEEERVRSLPVLPQYPPQWFQPPEKIDQRIEQAQFAIENAGMQAATIQIVSQAPVETVGAVGSLGTGAGGMPVALSADAPGEVLPVTTVSGDESAQVPGGAAVAAPPMAAGMPEEVGVGLADQPLQTESEDRPVEPRMAPLSDEEKGQGVLDQPAVPPLAMAGENLEEEMEPPKEDKKEKEEKGPVQEIRGVLELKPPDEEDTPFLTLTYDFYKIPHQFALSHDHQIFEYAYYKYKPMLVKAQKYIRRKQITKALNYYRVIREQQIPGEFRRMIDRNIKDITEYLQKYLMARQ